MVNPYQFSIRVSDILRRYVTEQYGLPVTRQTSVEFLERCSAQSPTFRKMKKRCWRFPEPLRPDQICALRRDAGGQPSCFSKKRRVL